MAHNSQEPLRTVVHGSTGRMGRVLMQAIQAAPDMDVVGTSSRKESFALDPGSESNLRETSGFDALLSDVNADIVVDFSNREAVMPLAETAAKHKAHFVTGTSGLTPEILEELRAIAAKHNIGVMVGPNFSLGAVVLERVASEAGRHFEYAEIVEMHHAGKADAPSGSAMATARGMLEARDGQQFANPVAQIENLEGVRGGDIDGVAIHSVRMPGLMAHQQVLLGGPGETLTLRHDVIDRESYMPGVLLAIREVGNRRGQLTYGLGALLWPERKGE